MVLAKRSYLAIKKIHDFVQPTQNKLLFSWKQSNFRSIKSKF